MKKLRSLFVIFVISLLLVSCAVFNNNRISIEGQVLSLEPEVFTTKYGNMYMNIDSASFLEAGFDYGDLVSVSFLDKTLVMAVVDEFSSLDSGVLGLVVKPEKYIMIGINYGNFTETYEIATKGTNADSSWYWTANEGVTLPIDFTFSMYEKEGYLSEYLLRHLVRTNVRSDYSELTDAEFANFRKIETTGMHNLYRTSNPVNAELGRNEYADNELKKAGVKTVLNLADVESDATAREEYQDTYYSNCNVLYMCMNLDFLADSFKTSLATILRYMIANPGPYAIHCTEGKDRAGFVCAILECFMGATADEVAEDYMKTFENFYNVEKGSEQYNAILEKSFKTTLENILGISDFRKANLQKAANDYIKSCGLTDAEINQLKAVL